MLAQRSPAPPTDAPPRRRHLAVGAVIVLLAGIVALLVPPLSDGAVLSWHGLLAPYSDGAALPGGTRIAQLRRGVIDEVVVDVVAADGAPAAQVHLLPRGCWSGVRASASLAIGYETLHSPAAAREEITEVLAQAVRRHDRGLPPPDAIPLRGAFDSRALQAMGRGLRGVLLLLSLGILIGLAVSRTRALAVAACTLGVVDGLARLSGTMHAPGICPADPIAIIDPGIRALQVAWALLIAASPLLAWRAARALDLEPRRLLLVIAGAMLLAAAAIWQRGDEPLHANWHAWREAREAVLPWRGHDAPVAPFLHGRGGIALQWLLAGAEHATTGAIEPLRISRVASIAAAGATAFLVALLLRSAIAGLAAGAALACMPLARMLAVSGSTLAVTAWLLPWTVGLLIAAGRRGDRLLLIGTALAAALGTLTHTALLAWPVAVVAAWLLAARAPWRFDRYALVAAVGLAAAWGAQLCGVHDMVAGRNEGGAGLLGQALDGVLHRNLMLDAAWLSPLLLPLAILGALTGVRSGAAGVRATSAALLIVAAPLFAVMACSSDAVRYQGALLGLLTALAVVGLWRLPCKAADNAIAIGGLRIALLASLIILPLPASQPPLDPAALEHRLVEEAVRDLAPGTLIVLPAAGGEGGRVRFDFPDFLLPPGSRALAVGDPAIDAHQGPRLLYLGLACVAWDNADGPIDPSGVRPECRALRGDAQPWAVRTLADTDIPRDRAGAPWTFFHFATGVPFGFFAPSPGLPDARGRESRPSDP